MTKKKAPQRVLVTCLLTVFLCLSAGPANAAAVYAWVANGSGVTAYDNQGNAVTLTGSAANGTGLYAHPSRAGELGASVLNYYIRDFGNQSVRGCLRCPGSYPQRIFLHDDQ